MAMPRSADAQMSNVKTVWVIPMGNHNWAGNKGVLRSVLRITKATD